MPAQPPLIPCDSAIERVDLYARGALVTRRARLPAALRDADPSAGLTLTFPGLSPMARLGSLRVASIGGGPVLGVDAELCLPARAAPEQGLRAQAQTLRRLAVDLDAQAHAVKQRRALLPHPPDMGLRGRRPNTHPAARALDALAVNDLLSTLAADLDAQLADLAARAADTRRLLAAAEAAASQASSADEAPTTLARPTARVRFAPASTVPASVSLTYEVPAARWWPAYTLRLDSASARARLSVEAFIAQDTFEDWSDVQISLITADLSAEVALPDLPSLRLGRPRTPKATGFRAPPQGLNLLFDGLDALISAQLPPPQPKPAPAPPSASANLTQAGTIHPEALKALEEGASLQDLLYRDHAPAPAQPMRLEMMPQAKRGGGVLSAIGGAAAAVVAAPVALGGALLKKERAPSTALARSRRQVNRVEADEEATGSFAYPGGAAYDGYGGGMDDATSDGDAFDLDAQWLNFDLLVMARFDAGSVRGRLRPKPASHEAPAVRDARQRIARAPDPAGTWDPRDHRGAFDHRFDAAGAVEVPADGLPHRVHLLSADAPYKTRFFTVPAELPQVFRMVDITNPLSAPLLPGPADVFMDGALVITSPLPKTDQGGHVSVGLGVEERVTVARNVRTQEQRRGLLKGTTHIENTVHIEVTSALPAPCALTLIDRVPTSTDPQVTITTLHASPTPQPYKQDDLGHPVEGGLRFALSLAPGERAEVSFTYAIELPAKLDIIGGGHRA